MIEHYFQLQFRMLNRSIRDFGLHPAVAYIFAVLGFVVISYLLFYKVSFAEYIFPFFALASMYKLCNEDRNHWLAMNLVNHFRKIRFLENLIIALPFLIFMLVKASYFGIIILCLGMAILTFYTSKEINNVAIPTPFSSRPFEFLVGFRRTFIMFIIAYFLCGMAIYVDNYALGLFSVIVPFWISISFYNNQERIYLVWMNSSNAKIFLSEKLKTALLFSNLTAFLPAIAMLVYNPGQFC